MSIRTKDCKKAIVDYIKENAGCVSSQFVPPEDEGPAQLISNWKRTAKSKENTETVREFNCVPYDDQLRAYVYDNGLKIVRIEILGE